MKIPTLVALKAFSLTLCLICCNTVTAWQADNGNGTFTNPLFYDEFSDPDLIRVGDDYYLTGTTMHAMPGLPILHSKDLVNWKLLSYALEVLDLEPRFRMENGQDIYGSGIWAPCFRYHNGTFYIFSNVNGRKTQLFTATDPSGPWKRRELNFSLHDLSVLFDEDGKTYVIWGYRNLEFAELNENFDIIPGTQKVLFAKNDGMGEGSHFHKINGKYYITNAWWNGRMRMPCARADHPAGPYEVNPEISADEEFGITEGRRLKNDRSDDFELWPPNPNSIGRMSLHQGGLVDTQKGEWWGFSMMDYNSVGRLTCLSPITWKNGWPYFGLPGNLGRTPRTWLKPDTGQNSTPRDPYERNDNFNGPQLANVWQWNHVPIPEKWTLNERPGYLRLKASPATDFWRARNTLTQRAIGPESIASTKLDTRGMKTGDVAGLALLNHPYAWIGVEKTESGLELQRYDRWLDETQSIKLTGNDVHLRVHCNFLTEQAQFSYSTDGESFIESGNKWNMVFQLRTFQGIRYSLFCYNKGTLASGHADFDYFDVEEPYPSGFTRPIPYGKTIRLINRLDDSQLAVAGKHVISVPETAHKNVTFKVVKMPKGRVAFETENAQRITVTGPDSTDRITLTDAHENDPAQSFQWIEMPHEQIALLSLETHRYLKVQPNGGAVTANAPGVDFRYKNGASFTYEITSEE